MHRQTYSIHWSPLLLGLRFLLVWLGRVAMVAHVGERIASRTPRSHISWSRSGDLGGVVRVVIG